MTDERRTWERAQQVFHNLLQRHKPVGHLIDFIEQVLASPYADGMYVSTHTYEPYGVAMAPHNEFSRRQDILEVIAMQNGVKLSFRYQGGWWYTNNGFATLERFLDRVRWFVDYRTTEIANPS
ncbi:MAG TPA: hypothetical protein VFA43_22290 [Gemmatimonadaceae bacterium]|nr:hypothetical protein [Gemmatimonadaceae bacterium]